MKNLSNKFSLFLLIALFLSAFLSMSCSSSSDDNDSEEYTPTQSDYEVTVGTVKSVSAMTNSMSTSFSSVQTDGISSIFSIRSENEDCPSVSIDKATSNVKINFDNNCEINEMSVSGSIAGTFSLNTVDGISLAIHLTFDEFMVEEDEIDGTITLDASISSDTAITLDCNVTYSEDGGQPSTLIVNDLAVTVSDNDTPTDFEDDTYTLNGTGTFTDADGKTYNLTFTNVKSTMACYVPVSGTMIITGGTPSITATVDYGDGTCDTLVDVTIGKKTQTIDISQPINLDL